MAHQILALAVSEIQPLRLSFSEIWNLTYGVSFDLSDPALGSTDSHHPGLPSDKIAAFQQREEMLIQMKIATEQTYHFVTSSYRFPVPVRSIIFNCLVHTI